MKIHALQHSSINTLGTIEEYAKIKNHSLESTRFYETKRSPTVDSFDLLIIMGGPIGVYDYKENPWLKDEKEFIKKAVESGKPILGICLGAQLLADVLGARVFDNKYMEMGWFPVKMTAEEMRAKTKESDFLKELPEEITVFHWHTRTFDLPESAVHLFESKGCKNQGFIYDDRIMALQFHPEVNEDRIESLIKRFGDGMAGGPYVQKKKEMLGQRKYLAGTKEFMFSILDKFEKITANSS